MTCRRANLVKDWKSFVETCCFLSLTLTVLLTGTTVALKFRHHNHKMIEKMLTNMTNHFPNITKFHSIGRSYKGRDLWVLVIGKHASQHTALVPNVKYIANMHGNEVVGREMLLHLAEHLLNAYGKNDTLTQFLDTTRIHLMPTMNPDGYSLSIREDCLSTYGRGNAYNYDLNRNFPDPSATVTYPEQRETTLVRNWIHSVPFVLSANLHGGALVVNYPYDSLKGELTKPVYAATPDDDVFRHLALTFSRSHHTMHSGNSCMKYFEDGITNGANWYPVIGGMQDYMYRNASGYEVLIEMSCCKYPHVSELPGMWQVNRDALINFLLAVHMGVKGIIYHEQTVNNSSQWMPLEGATIFIDGREEATFQSSSLGEFYKLLLPNNYILKVTYPGYPSHSIPFIVTDSKVTRLDVYMTNHKLVSPVNSHIPSVGDPLDVSVSVSDITTENLKDIESLKNTESPKHRDNFTQTESPRHTEKPKDTESPEDTEGSKHTESPKHTELSKYTESPKHTESFKRTVGPKLTESSNHTENPEHTESLKDTSEMSDTANTPSPPLIDSLEDKTTQNSILYITDTDKPKGFRPLSLEGNSTHKETFVDSQEFNLSEFVPRARENYSAISDNSMPVACISCGHWGFYLGICIFSLLYDQREFHRWFL